jgi:minor histocompatibility antigen H13
LGGLFFYDIFWVFGTEVMVSVAKTIDAPIKILFPTDFLTNGIFGTQHSMLGLGDIVIPGIMIALLARFDVSLGRNKNTYFHTGLCSFFVGLVVTMVVMNVFKHAQPALLYLVPSCLLLPLLVALVKGDHKALIDYEDEEAIEQRTEEAAAKESSEDKKDN